MAMHTRWSYLLFIAVIMIWTLLLFGIKNVNVTNGCIEGVEQMNTLFVYPDSNVFSSTDATIRKEMNNEFSTFYVEYIVKHNKFPSEDENILFMNQLYQKYNRSIHFIQIGANDGTADSFQKFLFDSSKSEHSCIWHGIMMEPASEPFAKLSHLIHNNNVLNDNVLLLNSALSDVDGMNNERHVLYTVDEQKVFSLFDQEYQKQKGFKPGFFRRIGSFKKEHVIKHLNKYRDQIRDALSMKIDDFMLNKYVQSMSASLVLETYDRSNKSSEGNNAMDVLILDAEGYDFVLLQQLMNNQYKEFKPLLIFYENVHLSHTDRIEAIEYLQKLNYVSFNAFGYNANAIKIDDYNLRLFLNYWANATHVLNY